MNIPLNDLITTLEKKAKEGIENLKEIAVTEEKFATTLTNTLHCIRIVNDATSKQNPAKNQTPAKEGKIKQ